MAHDVLISYSSKDKLQADAICNRLESQGIRCWIAPRDVPLGREYADSIVVAIESAKVVVLVFSTHADQSHQVRREIERAVSKGIPIVPVRIEDAKMSKAFELYVSSLHWLDAITPPLEQHIDKLARDLKALLSAQDEPAQVSAAAPAETVEPPRDSSVANSVAQPPAPASKRATGKWLISSLVGLMAAGALVLVAIRYDEPTPTTPDEPPLPAQPARLPNLAGYHYLKTMFLEPENRCLEGSKLGATNDPLGGAARMDPCGNFSGQLWRIVPVRDGYYRLKTMFLESENMCLEGGKVGTPNDPVGGAARMEPCADVSGQLWKIVPASGDYYRLKTMWLEPENMCLEGSKAGTTDDPLHGAARMDPCGNFSGQLWKIVSADKR